MVLLRAAGNGVGCRRWLRFKREAHWQGAHGEDCPDGQGYAVERMSSHNQYSAFGVGCQASLDDPGARSKSAGAICNKYGFPVANDRALVGRCHPRASGGPFTADAVIGH